jgi:diamine N-acetyltransferase
MPTLTKTTPKSKNKPSTQQRPLRLRPLEREDLRFVHELDNNESVMHYWFEEPYEAYVELCDLYDKHIHSQTERRFIIEHASTPVGLVELVEINHIHRKAEFQIIVAPQYQGKGYAKLATQLAIEYAFTVLNLYKLFLVVDTSNHSAIHIYKQLNFVEEGVLRQEFFVDGQYRDAVRMTIFQPDFLRDRLMNRPTGRNTNLDTAQEKVKTKKTTLAKK